MDLRCAALEVHVPGSEWEELLERVGPRVSASLSTQLADAMPAPDGNYHVTLYGEHVDEFLAALPTRSEHRKKIKALRPKRVVGEPR